LLFFVFFFFRSFSSSFSFFSFFSSCFVHVLLLAWLVWCVYVSLLFSSSSSVVHGVVDVVLYHDEPTMPTYLSAHRPLVWRMALDALDRSPKVGPQQLEKERESGQPARKRTQLD
jgi:hypothetical protein